MKYPIVRPAKMSDLSKFMQFAQDSGYGITSLPRKIDILEKKLLASEHSFHKKWMLPRYENYLFCLELEGHVIGTSGIISRVGVNEPFYAFQILEEAHVCPCLNIHRKIQVLHFIHSHQKPTEIGTLFLAPSFRGQEYGKLLSLSRFLFIAAFKRRFAPLIIAELRGVNYQGFSPFWHAIGRPFYNIDFREADTLRVEHHACIEEIFPKYPLYVELLPKEAQAVIGVAHTDTLPAKKMLENQGFLKRQTFDLFDAGPHLYAPTEEIHAIRESKEKIVLRFDPQLEGGIRAVIANMNLDFRATLHSLIIKETGVVLHPDLAEALQIEIGSAIRYYPI